METLDSFGDWLRRRRTALGLTRAELADCAGCSVSALRKLESDDRRPSRQLAELLAACLRISAEERSAFIEAARGVRPYGRDEHDRQYDQSGIVFVPVLQDNQRAACGGKGRLVVRGRSLTLLQEGQDAGLRALGNDGSWGIPCAAGKA